MTRKISRSVAKIHLSQLESFSLGNLDSKRDWGHAKDYVEVKHTHTQPEPHTSLGELDTNWRVEQSSDVHIALKRTCFPRSFEAAICDLHEASYDSLPKEKQIEKERGEWEERQRAACCEATDCTLVSHNSPMSQIPSGPHRHSPNARRRKRDMRGTLRSWGR